MQPAWSYLGTPMMISGTTYQQQRSFIFCLEVVRIRTWTRFKILLKSANLLTSYCCFFSYSSSMLIFSEKLSMFSRVKMLDILFFWFWFVNCCVYFIFGVLHQFVFDLFGLFGLFFQTGRAFLYRGVILLFHLVQAFQRRVRVFFGATRSAPGLLFACATDCYNTKFV